MTARRAFLQWLGAAPVVATAPAWAHTAASPSSASMPASRPATPQALGRGHVRLQDDRVSIQWDEQMRSRLVRLDGPRPLALTGFDAGESLLLEGGKAVDRFTLTAATPGEVNTPWGPGQQLIVLGRSAAGIEKSVTRTSALVVSSKLSKASGDSASPSSSNSSLDASSARTPIRITGWSSARMMTTFGCLRAPAAARRGRPRAADRRAMRQRTLRVMVGNRSG